MGKRIKDYWVNASKITRILFWILLFLGTSFIVASFFVPPKGVIDSSVLAAFGEIQGFASIGCGLSALEQGMSVKLSNGDTEIEVHKPEITN